MLMDRGKRRHGRRHEPDLEISTQNWEIWRIHNVELGPISETTLPILIYINLSSGGHVVHAVANYKTCAGG